MSVADLLPEHHPALPCLPESRLATDTASPSVIEVPANAQLFRDNEPCQGFPSVLDGLARVARRSTDGRELALYRVHRGEICVESTGCLFGSTPMTASDTAVTPARLAWWQTGTP